ncbi:MAG: hypothetical protein HC836_30625 [Richelia sp. RM2_1_2]|nr:hypothetical protein [Richelia sp. SM1_7_0]NJN11657.1 hypothetical protein [Richelia sp. RM1_1_1]NJO29919.1 hypothetical protein [Richelia sp. SL_2_1]NJO62425.1 hypothetical protein [Richelia sp. RM2_1_2]
MKKQLQKLRKFLVHQSQNYSDTALRGCLKSHWRFITATTQAKSTVRWTNVFETRADGFRLCRCGLNRPTKYEIRLFKQSLRNDF